MDARRERWRQDAIGEMVRKTDCVTITASGKTSVITVGGKKLGDVSWGGEKQRLQSLDKILKGWEALPEEERKPGLKLDYGAVDTKKPLVDPPANALVVRVYNRMFERDAQGKLRYTEADDFAEGEGRNGAARLRESAQDMMWIPETEWRAFIPENPEKGQSLAAPVSFALRLCKYHLDPERGLGEGIAFGGAKADAGKIVFTVEEVTPEMIRLRLEGSAKLVQGRPDGKQTIYEPALLGYVTYDVRAKAIIKFDMVALGDVTNTPRGVRPGAHPLGIAFELVRQPTVAERVVPRGGRDDVLRYLQITATGR
ncbi:hypothetical protein AYO44_10890 [Planctomycetaceae bacterium SCGC AG-212-F19]|nr:hypothetical protein AYO44_10890 [Planctomycetaceae bacterium SCGC AG-212-F19]